VKVNMTRLASGICAGAVMVAVAAAQSSAQSYKAPKTPWGEPDIQGNYSNLTEAMLYACLFEHREWKLRTVVAKVHAAMRSMGLRPDDRPSRRPVLDIYE